MLCERALEGFWRGCSSWAVLNGTRFGSGCGKIYLWNRNDTRRVDNVTQGIKSNQKWSRKSDKEWQKDVRGNQMEPKACKKEPESVPTGAKLWLNCIQKSTSERGSPNCHFFGTPGFHDHPFWAQISIKNAFKNQCKSQCRKNMEIYEKMLPKSC